VSIECEYKFEYIDFLPFVRI